MSRLHHNTSRNRHVSSPGRLQRDGILDTDNFKAYNDRYGHAAGDLVLRQVGALLRKHVRNPDDLAFRIGGEEFLVACKTREDGDSAAFFERIRSGIADLRLTHVGNQPYGVVTASVGVSVFRGPQNAGELFNAADAALYSAKRDGRNTIRFAPAEAGR